MCFLDIFKAYYGNSVDNVIDLLILKSCNFFPKIPSAIKVTILLPVQ